MVKPQLMLFPLAVCSQERLATVPERPFNVLYTSNKENISGAETNQPSVRAFATLSYSKQHKRKSGNVFCFRFAVLKDFCYISAWLGLPRIWLHIA
jgi:hypothetical protein